MSASCSLGPHRKQPGQWERTLRALFSPNWTRVQRVGPGSLKNGHNRAQSLYGKRIMRRDWLTRRWRLSPTVCHPRVAEARGSVDAVQSEPLIPRTRGQEWEACLRLQARGPTVLRATGRQRKRRPWSSGASKVRSSASCSAQASAGRMVPTHMGESMIQRLMKPETASQTPSEVMCHHLLVGHPVGQPR